jgi:hypothetical protein
MLDKTLVRFPGPNKFVPGGKKVHMPRTEFLQLLCFNGFQQCHLCSKKAYLVVDHSHRYPRLIRGLLCDSCNIAVGRFEHGHYNREMFDAIKAYLDNPPALQLGITRHYQEYYEGQSEEAS